MLCGLPECELKKMNKKRRALSSSFLLLCCLAVFKLENNIFINDSQRFATGPPYATQSNTKFVIKVAVWLEVKIIPGGIAQLGERLNGIQEVSGSIPLVSTKIVDNAE